MSVRLGGKNGLATSQAAGPSRQPSRKRTNGSVRTMRCRLGIGHDLSTPEGAVLVLEDAYRANDIEKAAHSKDFRGEAEQILRDRRANVRTEDIIVETARVLEMGHRAEIKKSGFPSMKGVTRSDSSARIASSSPNFFICPVARSTWRRSMSGTRKAAGGLSVLRSIQPPNQ